MLRGFSKFWWGELLRNMLHLLSTLLESISSSLLDRALVRVSNLANHRQLMHVLGLKHDRVRAYIGFYGLGLVLESKGR